MMIESATADVVFPSDGCVDARQRVLGRPCVVVKDKAERMEIVAGGCTVKLDGQAGTVAYAGGQAFEVPAKSGFDINVASGICEYVCSFLN